MFGFAASRGVMNIRQSGPGSATLGVLLATRLVGQVGGGVEDLALLV